MGMNTKELNELLRIKMKMRFKQNTFIVKPIRISYEEKYQFLHVMGDFLIPAEKKEEKLPVIVCVPDREMNGFEAKKLAGKLLAKKGYRVFCYNYGENQRITEEPTNEERVKCIVEVVKRVKKSKYTKKLFLLGIGRGADDVENALGILSNDVDGLIFYYPEIESSVFNSDFIEMCYQEDKKVDRKNYCSKFRGPVLMVHGERDEKVSVKNVRNLLDFYENATLNIISREAHGFSVLGRKNAADLCENFIEKIVS